MDKWLAKANETLESCFGIGTENETKQKMEAVTVSVIIYGCATSYFFLTFTSLSFISSEFRSSIVTEQFEIHNFLLTDFIEPHP